MDIDEMRRELLGYRDLFYGPRVREVRVTPAFAHKLRELCTYEAPSYPPVNLAYGTPVVVDDEVPSDPGYRVVYSEPPLD